MRNRPGPSRCYTFLYADWSAISPLQIRTVETPVDDHPPCKKKWSPTGDGLSWEVLHGEAQI